MNSVNSVLNKMKNSDLPFESTIPLGGLRLGILDIHHNVFLQILS